MMKQTSSSFHPLACPLLCMRSFVVELTGNSFDLLSFIELQTITGNETGDATSLITKVFSISKSMKEQPIGVLLAIEIQVVTYHFVLSMCIHLCLSAPNSFYQMRFDNVTS